MLRFVLIKFPIAAAITDAFHVNTKIAPAPYKNEKRIHPCQKPVALYRWLLQNYAKKGDKILDTHVGSASSLIACEMEDFEYVGFELDKDYYEAATKRIKQFRSQQTLDL